MYNLKETLKKKYFKYTGIIKRNKIKNKKFTIISNNCFAGIVYRNNAIEYQSPTCGLFIMPDDYIKFIYNLKHYLNIDKFNKISINESKHSDYLRKIKYNGIIGKLDDIEIMFLHYKTFEEAVEKWNRRKQRINYENIIYKFNDQNQCTYAQLEMFNDFKEKNKLLFTAKKYDNIDSIQFKEFEKYDYVLNDSKEKIYKKYIDIYKYLNERNN